MTGHEKGPNQIASSQHQPASASVSQPTACRPLIGSPASPPINLLPLLNSDRPAFNSIVDASSTHRDIPIPLTCHSCARPAVVPTLEMRVDARWKSTRSQLAAYGSRPIAQILGAKSLGPLLLWRVLVSQANVSFDQVSTNL